MLVWNAKKKRTGALPRKSFRVLVPAPGLEPGRPEGRQILSLLRLPISPGRLLGRTFPVYHRGPGVTAAPLGYTEALTDVRAARPSPYRWLRLNPRTLKVGKVLSAGFPPS